MKIPLPLLLLTSFCCLALCGTALAQGAEGVEGSQGAQGAQAGQEAQQAEATADALAKAAQNPLSTMVTRIDAQHINLLVGSYTNSTHPEGAAGGQVRVQINFMFPTGAK